MEHNPRAPTRDPHGGVNPQQAPFTDKRLALVLAAIVLLGLLLYFLTAWVFEP